jgi:hypothetical protein
MYELLLSRPGACRKNCSAPHVPPRAPAATAASDVARALLAAPGPSALPAITSTAAAKILVLTQFLTRHPRNGDC